MIFTFFLIHIISSISIELSADKTYASFHGKQEELTSTFVSDFTSKSSLRRVEIKEGITSLGSSAFNDYKLLYEVKLPPKLRIIFDSAFKYCSSLKTIEFGDGLEQIYDSCFFGCSALENIFFPESFEASIGLFCFYHCLKLKNISVSPNNKVYKHSQDHQILVKNNVTAVVGGCGPKIVIPDYIEEISNGFMNSRNNVNEVQFSNAGKLHTIGSWAFRETSIRRIKFPSGVKKIDNSPLSNPSVQIEYMFIPATVESIDSLFDPPPLTVVVENGSRCMKVASDGVIYDLNETTMLFIPSETTEIFVKSTVTQIEPMAISESAKLVRLNVSESNPNYCAYDNALYKKEDGNLTELLAGVGGITSVRIHENCTNVASGAFSKTRLSSVVFEGTKVESIAGFTGIKSLTYIKLPNGLQEVKDYCFRASSLVTVEFSPSIKSLGYQSFPYMPITKVNLSSCVNLTVINGEAFTGDNKLVTLVMPPNIRTISSKCFESCSSIKSIIFPQYFQSLSSSCFKSCSSLCSVQFLGSQIVTFPSSCFSGCNLSEIEIPESVESIHQLSFENNRFLTEIVFRGESKLKSLQIDSFVGCSSLTNITFGKDLQSIAPGALSQMNGLLSFIVDESNPIFMDANGTLYSHTERVPKGLVAFPGGRTSITIPASVEVIWSFAFFRCESLIDVNFSDQSVLNSIGESTFFECTKLKSIRIPESVSNVSSRAFSGCIGLNKVEFLDRSKLAELQEGVFDGCSSLSEVVFGNESSLASISSNVFKDCRSLQSFDFPRSLSRIGVSSFEGCVRLRSVNLMSIMSLGSRCFYGCSMLSDISLSPQVRDVGSSCFGGCGGLRKVVYCGFTSFDVRAFGKERPAIFVPVGFEDDEQFALPVLKVLDGDCNIPSAAFTQHPLFQISTELAFSLLDESGSV